MAENLNPQVPQQPTQAPMPPAQDSSFMPPGSQPPQGMPSSGSSGPNKNILIGIVVAVVLLISVVGYGFWNGSQVASYATRAEEIVNDIEKKVEVLKNSDLSSLSFDQFASGSFDAELKKLKDETEEFATEIDKYYQEVAKKGVPGKASGLGKNLKEYTQLAKEFGESSKYGIQIMEATVGVVEGMSDLMYSSSSEDEMMVEMEKMFNNWLDELEKITPPESAKDVHDKLIKLVGDVTKALGDGNYDIFNDIEDPFDEMSKYLEDKENRIKSLKDEILKEAPELKKTNFVLF